MYNKAQFLNLDSFFYQAHIFYSEVKIACPKISPTTSKQSR